MHLWRAADISSLALPQGGPIIDATTFPTCALPIFTPEIGGCVTYASTTTSTVYTECGGCALSTMHLAPGPVSCRKGYISRQGC